MNSFSKEVVDEKQNVLLEKIQVMKDSVGAKRPILGQIMKKHGDDNLFEYTKDFLDINPNTTTDSRKKELIDVVESVLKDRLGEDVANEVATQLTRSPLISTTDHHGPIDHPFWVNANIISSLPHFEEELSTKSKYLVVFSFSSVSLNNASGYPRGILFHGSHHVNTEMIRLPFFPDKEKMGIVYATRPYTQSDIVRAKEHLQDYQQDNHVTVEQQTMIMNVICNFFEDQKVMDAHSFAEQITIINYLLWPHLFHSRYSQHKSQTYPSAVPQDLIYIEIETIVASVLCKYHLDNVESLIHKALFDNEYREKIQMYFADIPGAFSHDGESGSYLFWGIDKHLHRMRLFLTDGILHNLDYSYQCVWTPESLRNALEKKEIFPGMILCYLVVSLYYGMKCLGGFCQVHDLTLTKKAWQEVLRSVGNDCEASAVESVQTKELGGDGMVLCYLHRSNGHIVPATGIDMIIHDVDVRPERFLSLAKQVTLNQIMAPMLPEMYEVLYPMIERNITLSSLKPEDIVLSTGLADILAGT